MPQGFGWVVDYKVVAAFGSETGFEVGFNTSFGVGFGILPNQSWSGFSILHCTVESTGH